MSAIGKRVVWYARKMNLTVPSTWGKFYDEFYRETGQDLPALAKRAGVGVTAYLAREGWEEKARMVAERIFQ